MERDIGGEGNEIYKRCYDRWTSNNRLSYDVCRIRNDEQKENDEKRKTICKKNGNAIKETKREKIKDNKLKKVGEF